jgi:UDP-N-acetylglucosamine transferase subunit ALG13
VIFGTVGTHTAPFDRLVRALDEFAATTSEPVVIQIGASTYEPRSAAWFRMVDSESFTGHLHAARLMVTHAADSLLEAIQAGKPVVAVPRQRRFREHLDDHQVELGRELRRTLNLQVVFDVATLPAALMAATPVWPREGMGGAQLRHAIQDAIGALARETRS